MTTTWTPERIASVKATLVAGIRPDTTWGAIWDLLAAAEIGLAVIKADEALLTRMQQAIARVEGADGGPEPPVEWWHGYREHSLEALAALKEGCK